MTAVEFSVAYEQRESKATAGAGWVRGTFGLAFDQPLREFVPATRLDIEPGQIALFNGPSGSGKSSALRQTAEQMDAVWMSDLHVDNDRLVIDQLGDDPESAMQLAGRVGLAEAPLFVRYPHELSDGQQYRFRVALAVVAGHDVIAADEWCATLDRVTAKVVSRNVRKLVTERGMTLLCATSHDDLVDDLAPDHLVKLSWDDPIEVDAVPFDPTSRSTTGLPLSAVRDVTGRTSPRGTTAGTR